MGGAMEMEEMHDRVEGQDREEGRNSFVDEYGNVVEREEGDALLAMMISTFSLAILLLFLSGVWGGVIFYHSSYTSAHQYSKISPQDDIQPCVWPPLTWVEPPPYSEQSVCDTATCPDEYSCRPLSMGSDEPAEAFCFADHFRCISSASQCESFLTQFPLTYTNDTEERVIKFPSPDYTALYILGLGWGGLLLCFGLCCGAIVLSIRKHPRSMQLLVLVLVMINVAIDVNIVGGFMYQQQFNQDNCEYECLGTTDADNPVKMICSLQITTIIGFVLFLLVPLGQCIFVVLYLCGFGCFLLYGLVRGCLLSVRYVQQQSQDPVHSGVIFESE